MSKLQVFIFCDKYKNCGVIFFLLRETSKRVGFNVLNIILRELPLSNDNRVVNFYSLDLSNLCYYFFFSIFLMTLIHVIVKRKTLSSVGLHFNIDSIDERAFMMKEAYVIT